MEGDVEGIMERPEGEDEDARQLREKWEAWQQFHGLSRTEAKRRYIETLLETMHKYASQNPDARELIAELDFVWDQVKSNVSSSSSSSPSKVHERSLNMNNLDEPPSYPGLGLNSDSRSSPNVHTQVQEQPMKVLSPLSQSEEEDPEDIGEEFVDAPDSQYEPKQQSDHSSGVDKDLEASKESFEKSRDAVGLPQSDQRWRRRIERALVKMTAEIAALREQLESRRLFGRRRSVIGWLLRVIWFAVKHIAVNAMIILLIIVWMRRKKDQRFEGAVRVLLGDAVAQMQKVSNVPIRTVGKTLPKIQGRKT
jgi:hypothetical protein